MRQLILIYSFVIFLVTACGTGSQKSNGSSVNSLTDTGRAVLIFREYEHSFGKVEEGEKIGYVFSFENQGTGDLVIQNAITSCGCTVSKYDRKPIAPGKSGKLEVVFDTSDRNGPQTKTITVKSNATVPAVILKITAEVEADK
jgi:hypothetical protein